MGDPLPRPAASAGVIPPGSAATARFGRWTWILLLVLWAGAATPAWAKDANWLSKVQAMLRDGSVLVVDPAGKAVLTLNATKPEVPASVLKVLTALVALDGLGPDYRFVTEFRLSAEGDLYVVGRGDPFLVSEELDFIGGTMKEMGLQRVRHIFLDDRFFTPGLVLDGTERTLNPYDAYNGALCVNFNTINVQVGPGGQVASAEPQTPLTDLARAMALKSGLKGQVRLNLADSPALGRQYAGELIKAFLNKAGVEVSGRIQDATRNPAQVPLFYRHLSRKTLPWLLTQMFEYSNNFMANQIWLTLGAEKMGPPATAEKARQTAARILTARKLPAPYQEEGSGLSFRTMVTATDLVAYLRFFLPYRELLRQKGAVWYKGGSLTGVKTLVGYVMRDNGGPYVFAILINHPQVRYDDPDRILDLIRENLIGEP